MSNIELSIEADQLEGVLAPEQTKNLIGHQEQFLRLNRQISNAKLAHTILLHGERGIGKASFAFCLARKILLKTGSESEERIFEQIANGSHPNIFTLRRKKNENTKGFYTVIRVEDIRELQRKIRQTAGVKASKICIIDSIDDCNKNSANALLKILEEPPKNSFFILISHQFGALLPTIRSRAYSVALRRLKNEEIRTIVENSNIAAQSPLIDNAIELAKGSARRAFAALQIVNINHLNDLQNWLNSKKLQENPIHLQIIANIIAAGKAEENFAKDIILDWIANEAKYIIKNSPMDKKQIASISKLWEKAQSEFEKAKIYNLNKEQSFILIIDAIREYLTSKTNFSIG